MFGPEPRHTTLVSATVHRRWFSVLGEADCHIVAWGPCGPYEQMDGKPSAAISSMEMVGEQGESSKGEDEKKGDDQEGDGGEPQRQMGQQVDWRCGGKDCGAKNDASARICAKCSLLKPVLSQVELHGAKGSHPVLDGANCLYTRRYGSTFLGDDENWIVSLLEPVLEEVYGDDKDLLSFSLWLPAEPVPADAGAAMLIGCDMDAHNTWKEVHVLRIGLVQVFALREHGRRVYRTLIYTSDTRMSLRSLQPRCDDRSFMWRPQSRHSAGNLTKAHEPEASLVILRECPGGVAASGKSEQGAVLDDDTFVVTDPKTEHLEQFVPSELLHGLLPDALLDTFRFWQSCGGAHELRGISRRASEQFYAYSLSVAWTRVPEQRALRKDLQMTGSFLKRLISIFQRFLSPNSFVAHFQNYYRHARWLGCPSSSEGVARRRWSSYKGPHHLHPAQPRPCTRRQLAGTPSENPD